jgi:YVTN family beta-propeller protein
MQLLRFAFIFIVALAACGPQGAQLAESKDAEVNPRLPTGVYLDPAGRSFSAGSMPLALALSPDGTRVVLLLNGWREQGIQVLDRGTGAAIQTIPQASAFLGLAFSPDGKWLYASGGNDDVVHRYTWTNGHAENAGTIPLAEKPKNKDGTRYPAGIGLSPDGKTMYVAENLADSVAVVDLATGKVKQRLATERYPYGVTVAGDGSIYVSAWGGSTVSVFRPTRGGTIQDLGRVAVGRHPSAMTLSRDGGRLFITSGSTDRIAVMDTRTRRVIATLEDPPPAGPHEGSTPNALALSNDGKRLFVAEADNNAVAVFNLSLATSGVSTTTDAANSDKLAGRIPMGWYPAALAVANDSLFVVNAKGNGTAANPKGPQPDRPQRFNPPGYVLGQLSGTLTMLRAVKASAAEIDSLSMRVARANGWNDARPARRYPPIEHVIYVIKENRTYDQVLGDLPAGDGDTSLVFFPRRVSPNHHVLAERFGIFDRFFVNAEVSADGHNWSTASYTTDYVQKTVPSQYSSRGRHYDYEGTNRNAVPDDDVAEPGTGYLWNLAQRAGITFRNYGEFTIPQDSAPDGAAQRYRADKPYLRDHTHEKFSGYDLNIQDQLRADIWIAELQEFAKVGRMPALEIVRLPNDHTAGLRAGSPTPAAYMADNDLALGRIVEALSKTSFWKSTVMFVLEDDAQNGPDHVDSHRSPLLVISPYSRGGVSHWFANTTDVIATIEDILGLGRLSQFDHYSRPLNYVWKEVPDMRPYVALKPGVSLDEKNPRVGIGARESRRLALEKEDQADEDLFNRILWRGIKGEGRPWPGIKRMSALEYRR